MVYGFGRGQGSQGGARLGFRGSSPPWPYVGRGKGGLPHCQYPGTALSYRETQFPAYRVKMTSQQELDLLKSQAGEIKKEFERIESRIHDLEANRKE